MKHNLFVLILILAGISQATTHEDLKEFSKSKHGIFELYLQSFDSKETPADKINKIMTEVLGFKSEGSNENWFKFVTGKETTPAYPFKEDFGKDDQYFIDLMLKKIENHFIELVEAQEKEEAAETKAENQSKYFQGFMAYSLLALKHVFKRYVLSIIHPTRSAEAQTPFRLVNFLITQIEDSFKRYTDIYFPLNKKALTVMIINDKKVYGNEKEYNKYQKSNKLREELSQFIYREANLYFNVVEHEFANLLELKSLLQNLNANLVYTMSSLLQDAVTSNKVYSKVFADRYADLSTKHFQLCHTVGNSHLADLSKDLIINEYNEAKLKNPQSIDFKYHIIPLLTSQFLKSYWKENEKTDALKHKVVQTLKTLIELKAIKGINSLGRKISNFFEANLDAMNLDKSNKNILKIFLLILEVDSNDLSDAEVVGLIEASEEILKIGINEQLIILEFRNLFDEFLLPSETSEDLIRLMAKLAIDFISKDHSPPLELETVSSQFSLYLDRYFLEQDDVSFYVPIKLNALNMLREESFSIKFNTLSINQIEKISKQLSEKNYDSIYQCLLSGFYDQNPKYETKSVSKAEEITVFLNFISGKYFDSQIFVNVHRNFLI